MHVDLHWLDMPLGVKFKLVSMVHNCLHHGQYCIPISDVASRRHLRSARRHYLVVPRHSLSSYGRRAFAVACPTAWNSLSDDLCYLTLSTDSFTCLLKNHLFSQYSTYIALDVSYFMPHINFTTYLYLLLKC